MGLENTVDNVPAKRVIPTNAVYSTAEPDAAAAAAWGGVVCRDV